MTVKTSTDIWCDLCDECALIAHMYGDEGGPAEIRKKAKKVGWIKRKRRPTDPPGTADLKMIDVCGNCVLDEKEEKDGDRE